MPTSHRYTARRKCNQLATLLTTHIGYTKAREQHIPQHCVCIAARTLSVASFAAAAVAEPEPPAAAAAAPGTRAALPSAAPKLPTALAPNPRVGAAAADVPDTTPPPGAPAPHPMTAAGSPFDGTAAPIEPGGPPLAVDAPPNGLALDGAPPKLALLAPCAAPPATPLDAGAGAAPSLLAPLSLKAADSCRGSGGSGDASDACSARAGATGGVAVVSAWIRAPAARTARCALPSSHSLCAVDGSALVRGSPGDGSSCDQREKITHWCRGCIGLPLRTPSYACRTVRPGNLFTNGAGAVDLAPARAASSSLLSCAIDPRRPAACRSNAATAARWASSALRTMNSSPKRTTQKVYTGKRRVK
jgi:hypothetical protein